MQDDAFIPAQDSTEPLSRELRAAGLEGAGLETAVVLGLTVLAHPDRRRVGERALLSELAGGRPARLSRHEPLFAAPAPDAAPTALDHRRLSRRPLIFETAGSGVRLSRAESGTAVVADGEPLSAELGFGPEALERGVVLLLGERIVLLLHRLRPLLDYDLPAFGLVGASAAVQRLRQQLRKVAGLAVPVLLRGESGSGKELVAHALHAASPRRGGPFVAVNMAAVPASLAAAELFGAARGAFTGAERARPGYFSRAAGGTLFLDEVGEMPVEVQTLLLRCLETGEIQPVGEAAPHRVDVRLVAATDADLETAVADGRFKAPLLHRLAGFVIHLPPLRERRDDVGRLLARFLEEELSAAGAAERLDADPPWLPAEIVARLAMAGWPGNVRQLRNVVRQLVIDGHDTEVAQLDPVLAAQLDSVKTPPAPEPSPPPNRPLAEIDEDELLAALRAEGWRPHAAARRLGIPRPSIYHLMRKSTKVRIAADIGHAELAPLLARHGDDLAAIAAELEVSELALRRRLGELGF